jgi:hypothetical protein
MEIDLIVRNARIVTMEDAVPRAHTLAVHHGRVLALDPDGLRGRVEIDAQGAALVPGFGDAHNHMAWFGSSLDEVDLSGLTDLATLYHRVAQRAATLAPDARDHPARRERRPVLIIRTTARGDRTHHRRVRGAGAADVARPRRCSDEGVAVAAAASLRMLLRSRRPLAAHASMIIRIW